MSDGPYKSLNMTPAWKRVAKVAANPTHSVAEVAEAYRPALLQDWGAVQRAFDQEVRRALGDSSRGALFTEIIHTEVRRLCATASNPMESLLAAQAWDVARDGQLGLQAYEGAVRATLEDRAIQRALQMEEHYLRENSRAAGPLRAKLHASIGAIGIDNLTAGIAAHAGVRSLAHKIDRSGLDEGPRL